MTPLCTAPFHSVLIDTDKTVKPCCAWADEPLGDLKITRIYDILNGTKLKAVQEQLLKNEWPIGCKSCKEREAITGYSTRLTQYNDSIVPYQINNNLTYLEFNSSTLCNLVCVGCNPNFSSSWENFIKDNQWTDRYQHKKLNSSVIMLDFISDFLKTIDLSKLTFVTFKGGEPFLNKEIIMLLEHLDNIGVLKNIEISVFTNGTIISDKLLSLLNKAKFTSFHISIDGLGELNQYIRFDPKNPEKSHTDEIKKNILKYIKLPNAQVGVTPSIQAHNIFNLEDLRKFWVEEICLLDEVKIQKEIPFTHFILWPQECAISVYSDATRHKLADYYESLNLPQIYHKVINALLLPYAGDKWHNQFVKYTQALDKTRLTSFVDLVPEAADEMILL